MIWIWIIAAWVLSYAALGKKKVRFEHLIWMLLPVDMYGIQVAGVMLKPYMLFCVLLFLRLLAKKRMTLRIRSQWTLISVVVILLCLPVNMFNSQSTTGVMTTMMLLVVWGCALLYLNECRKDSAEEICDVILATGLGYGMVFVFAYVTSQLGMELPGVLTANREEPGLFLRFSNVYQEQLIRTVRLRGFMIDPNSMLGPFLYSTVIASLRLVKDKGGLKEVLAIVFSALCVMLSNSRMGLICFCAIIVGSAVLGYKMASTRIRNIVKKGLMFVGPCLMIALLTTDLVEWIVELVASAYANRSALTDQYGRFSVWSEALSIWWDKNILFGIGFGQMQYYTTTGRACHNTWLELICGCGILVGSIFIIHFCVMMFRGLRWALARRNTEESPFTWTMVLGTLGVMLSLVSVDNVTYSYLWFGALTVSAISRGYWQKR